MKKPKVRYSKTPPPGWPTEAQWKKLDKMLEKGLGTLILPADADAVDKTKYELCRHFVEYYQKATITQREFAKRLEVTESRVSEILHYRVERFTIDKLLALLSKIKPDVRIKIA